jgi:hypothetical protein
VERITQFVYGRLGTLFGTIFLIFLLTIVPWPLLVRGK